MSTDDSAAREARVRAPADPLLRIRELARVLRGPGGCPWDGEQTVESLTPYLQEETFEVVEAIAERDRVGFREELGDLLFLCLLLGTVAEETGWGSMDDVSLQVLDKLIRRHPHVFDEGELEPGGALRQWEQIKRGEKTGEDASVSSTLGRRPAGLPALTTAFRISEKAGAVGFEYPDPSGALAKVDEELAELRAEIAEGAPTEAVEEEIGDLLYAVANLARYLAIDPERALRATTAKFLRRFRYIEDRLRERGATPEESTLEEMDRLWTEAKNR